MANGFALSAYPIVIRFSNISLDFEKNKELVSKLSGDLDDLLDDNLLRGNFDSNSSKTSDPEPDLDVRLDDLLVTDLTSTCCCCCCCSSLDSTLGVLDWLGGSRLSGDKDAMLDGFLGSLNCGCCCCCCGCCCGCGDSRPSNTSEFLDVLADGLRVTDEATTLFLFDSVGEPFDVTIALVDFD